MKLLKFFSKSFCVVLAVVLCFSVSFVLASQLNVTYKNINFYLDGNKINLEGTDSNGNKVKPFISNGITYVPVAAVAKAFGKDSRWDSKTNSIYFTTNNNTNSNNSGDAGSGFSYSNLNYYQKEYDEIKVTCQITNNSGKNYTEPRFMISAYDNSGNLLASSTEEIDGLFKNGTNRHFSEDIDFPFGTEINNVSYVEVKFIGGY